MLVRNEKCGIRDGNITRCGEKYQVSKQVVWKR
jgi:hypothetical protein